MNSSAEIKLIRFGVTEDSGFFFKTLIQVFPADHPTLMYLITPGINLRPKGILRFLIPFSHFSEDIERKTNEQFAAPYKSALVS